MKHAPRNRLILEHLIRTVERDGGIFIDVDGDVRAVIDHIVDGEITELNIVGGVNERAVANGRIAVELDQAAAVFVPQRDIARRVFDRERDVEVGKTVEDD